MLLADAAQVSAGKLYILGGGWSVTGPGPAPSAVAVKFEVERSEFFIEHHWTLSLEDADGYPVMVGDDEPQPIMVSGSFNVDNDQGLAPWAPADVPVAVNFGPIPLRAAARYTWRLTVNGEVPVNGYVSFSTRP